jgi:Na+-driven multidrug efflux pump
MYELLQKYFQSQQIVMPALIVNVLFVGINAGLNILLIFGVGNWNG